jgi:hypothetical protein
VDNERLGHWPAEPTKLFLRLSEKLVRVTVRPWGLLCYQGVPTALVGAFMLAAELLSVGSRNAAMIAIGIAFFVVAAMSWMPVLKVDSQGMYVRNFLRSRRLQRHEVHSVGLRHTPLLLSRGISFSRFVVNDGTRDMVVTATTGMSLGRAGRLLAVLRSTGFPIASDVALEEFPVHDSWGAMQKAGEQAATEWEKQQETYRRIERARQEREQRHR